MKYKVVRCYNPKVGTWYIIQKRILWWWKDLPFAFDSPMMANQFIAKHEDVEFITKNPLDFYNGEFVNIYDISKTIRKKVRV